MKKILICTGGTGGHIFPVIALTEYLKKQSEAEQAALSKAKRGR